MLPPISAEAENKPLDHTFTEAIKKENSWKNSPVFPLLRNYKGKTMVVYGEHEEVIPKEIQQTYMQTAENNGGESHIIKNTGHKMLKPTNDGEQEAIQKLFQLTTNFLSKNL